MTVKEFCLGFIPHQSHRSIDNQCQYTIQPATLNAKIKRGIKSVQILDKCFSLKAVKLNES